MPIINLQLGNHVGTHLRYLVRFGGCVYHFNVNSLLEADIVTIVEANHSWSTGAAWLLLLQLQLASSSGLLLQQVTLNGRFGFRMGVGVGVC